MIARKYLQLPLPDSTIVKVEALARRDKAKNDITFLDRDQIPY